MLASNHVDWEVCTEQGCIGVRLSAATEKCWAHADDEGLNNALVQLKKTGHLDARGVRITAALLERLLGATPTNSEGKPVLRQASFNRAEFRDQVALDHVEFGDNVSFEGALFSQQVSFQNARFGSGVSFGAVHFADRAEFFQARFGDSTQFEGAWFAKEAMFLAAQFGDQSSFGASVFEAPAMFSRVIFGNQTRFNAIVHGVSFDDATFGDDTNFLMVGSADEVSLDRCSFGMARCTGPSRSAVIHLEDLTVVGSEFTVIGHTVKCKGVHFPNGITLRAAWADVRLDQVQLSRASSLTTAQLPPQAATQANTSTAAVNSVSQWRKAQPRLLSLAGTDVAQLTVAEVDLRACYFSRAYNLDQLRIEGKFPFADCPEGWRRRGRWPVWRWTVRRALAEEHAWRADFERGARWTGWLPPSCRRPGDQPPEQRKAATEEMTAEDRARLRQQDARELTQMYQALRKGLEDRKDEPGAADFYYGEMEMRRQGSPRRSFERALLWAYWLVSGYGLRASRALATLLGVVLLAAVLFTIWGFDREPNVSLVDATPTGAPIYRKEMPAPAPTWERLPDALGYSVESATALLSGPERPLTPIGQWIQAVLRLLGPLLYGLAVLSLRGRVKR